MTRALPALAFAALAAAPAFAQPDPWAARLRVYTDTPIATFQGAECVSIAAPKAVVWKLLVAPENAATWMLAGLEVVPRRARYAKGWTASKGDVLSLEVTTNEGPRRVELTVIAFSPGEVLSFLVKVDEANLMDASTERLTASFFVDGRPDGTTDLTWVAHYDSDSPFSALFSPVGARSRKNRRQGALNLFKAIAEEAARLPNPPLHDVPTSEQPTTVRRKK